MRGLVSVGCFANTSSIRRSAIHHASSCVSSHNSLFKAFSLPPPCERLDACCVRPKSSVLRARGSSESGSVLPRLALPCPSFPQDPVLGRCGLEGQWTHDTRAMLFSVFVSLFMVSFDAASITRRASSRPLPCDLVTDASCIGPLADLRRPRSPTAIHKETSHPSQQLIVPAGSRTSVRCSLPRVSSVLTFSLHASCSSRSLLAGLFHRSCVSHVRVLLWRVCSFLAATTGALSQQNSYTKEHSARTSRSRKPVVGAAACILLLAHAHAIATRRLFNLPSIALSAAT